MHPSYALIKNASGGARDSSMSTCDGGAVEYTPVYRGRSFGHRRSLTDISGSSKTAMPDSPTVEVRARSCVPSPRKENRGAGSASPARSPTPDSCA